MNKMPSIARDNETTTLYSMICLQRQRDDDFVLHDMSSESIRTLSTRSSTVLFSNERKVTRYVISVRFVVLRLIIMYKEIKVLLRATRRISKALQCRYIS